MCLGIPGKVVSLNQAEQWAVVESFGVRKKIGIDLIDEEIAPGDYLMVHAGYAIGKIDQMDAQVTLEMWEEILDAE
ncbi:MAG: HypC/HybG/HupF family hydrogenase formation chaperone [Desulfotomaculaceae bacterium]|nr:HypC/HybG/HupF family hydrogenase formation chaperone [Desulfotomaculaceae bacterium]